MAEIVKLSVGKGHDTLRKTDAPTGSKLQRLDDKNKQQDHEVLRLRGIRSLGRDQRAASARPEGDETKPASVAGKMCNWFIAAFTNIIGRRQKSDGRDS